MSDFAKAVEDQRLDPPDDPDDELWNLVGLWATQHGVDFSEWYGQSEDVSLEQLLDRVLPKQLEESAIKAYDYHNVELEVLNNRRILERARSDRRKEERDTANNRIAALEANLATVTAERNEAFSVGTALEADLARARGEALSAAILEVQGCIEPYSELDGTDEEKVAISNASLRYAITRIDSLRTAAQPEPETPVVKTGHGWREEDSLHYSEPWDNADS